MNKILVILNPAARGERARDLKQRIEALSIRAVVWLTEAPGDAKSLAAEGIRQGFPTIIAAGGDGTVNEVVNGIGCAEVQFGILPVGTMNVFALELGLPLNNLAEAWKVIEDGSIRQLDLPTANQDYFVQLSGAGLDAEVVMQTTHESKKVLGPLSYMVSLAQAAARRPPLLRIAPSQGEVREGSFALVGNGRYYGGPFELFPQARPDDGMLDVLVFKNQSHWDVIRYMQAILFRSHPKLPDVDYFQTPSLEITSADPVPVEIDGEFAGTLPYRFGIAEKKLSILTPNSRMTG